MLQTSISDAYNLANDAYSLASTAKGTADAAYAFASGAYDLAAEANASAYSAYASAITNAVKYSDGITSSAPNLVTASAVAEYVTGKIDDAALVWLDANGSPIN